MFKMLKRMYTMAEGQQGKIVQSLISQMLDNALSFVPLCLVLLVFQNIFAGTLETNFAFVALGIMLAGVALRSIARYSMDKNSYGVTLTLFYNERIKIADYLKKLNMGFYTDDNLGKLNHTLINGMTFLEEKFLHAVLDSIAAAANLIVIGIIFFVMEPVIALVYGITVLLVFVLMVPYQKAYDIYSAQSTTANENLTGAVIEYVKNISAIKAFHLVGKHKRSNEAFSKRLDSDLKAEVINIPYLIGAMCIMSISTFCMIYWLLSQHQSMEPYTMITLSILSLYVFGSLLTIISSVGSVAMARDTFRNIDNLYAQKSVESKGDKKPGGYDIAFKDVEFAYETNNVIDGVSFALKEHTLNALVGLSGSGKSTLVNLIPRFYEIQKGSICIGGVDIREMSEETLHSCISMVFQNVYLFNDTVYNNIAFGKAQARKEEVIEATKKAKCYDFIMALPDGFDTVIGEAGLNLSGGERQRISIARAILKDAPIILLDEATASIDADNERDIQLAINALVKDKTILVIAHKLSCVKNAAKILVIDGGKLVEEGTHETLVKKEGLYRTLCEKRVNSKAWVIENA